MRLWKPLPLHVEGGRKGKRLFCEKFWVLHIFIFIFVSLVVFGLKERIEYYKYKNEKMQKKSNINSFCFPVLPKVGVCEAGGSLCQ